MFDVHAPPVALRKGVRFANIGPMTYQVQPIPAGCVPVIINQPGFEPAHRLPLPGVAEVDLWLLSGAALAPFREALSSALSAEERARCDRLVQPADRATSILFRGVLRHLLSGYLGTDPTDLTFERSLRGKPELAPPYRAAGLSFNLSHSRDMLAVACWSGRQVGVDIEYRDRTCEVTALARRFYHPAEQAQLAALDPAAQADQFFRWWTAKEALVKAWGCGLVDELAELNLCPWSQSAYWGLQRTDGTAWFGWPLAGPDGLAGMVVTDQPARVIRTRGTVPAQPLGP